MKLWNIALRNIFRNGRRSVLSVLAVAVAAMSITLLFALVEGIKEDVRHNAWNYESGEVRLRNSQFDRYEYLNPVHYVLPNYEAVLQELESMPEVAALSPRINVNAAAFRGERRILARGIAVDLERERSYQDLDALVVSGRLPESGRAEALLGSRLARELGVEVGDSATFLTQTRVRGSNAFTVDVVGLASFPVALLDRAAFIMPLDVAAGYLRMGDAVSEILIKADGRSGDALAERLNAELAPRHDSEQYLGGQLQASSWTELSAGYRFLRIADVVYSVIALFFFLLAGTVIINTTMMTVHERTQEIGTLGSMGMRGRELVRLFFTEAAYLGFAGSLFGVLLGVAVAVPLGRVGIDFGAAMEMVEMDISTVLYPVLNFRSTVWVFLYSFVVAVLASFPPAVRAARLRPVDALRG
ncbi:MAG: ABC transporter permease [Spirochaetaceae bacterium]|nr:MAG: ABC transporter permease [Spirochaetaceae bacterium]